MLCQEGKKKEGKDRKLANGRKLHLKSQETKKGENLERARTHTHTHVCIQKHTRHSQQDIDF